jgi:hypothetical protein
VLPKNFKHIYVESAKQFGDLVADPETNELLQYLTKA